MEPTLKVRGLTCLERGRNYPAAPLHVCEFRFGPLEVDDHCEAIGRRVTGDRIAAGPSSVWRYRDLLPVDDEAPIDPHVGFTPLVRARNLAEELGVREPIVICVTGNGLKTMEATENRLGEPVRIPASLTAFDRALADLKTLTQG